jgi:tetratricopeptide (TPR) repeat protein
MKKQTIGLIISLLFNFFMPLHAQVTPKSVVKPPVDSVQQLAKDWFDKGVIKYNLNNYAESIADFDTSIQLITNAFAFNYRGNAQYKLGWYVKAIADYDQALRIIPDADVYNNRAVARRNVGQFKEAIADYDQAIELKPDYAVAFNGRGLAKVALKQYDLALLDFNQAIKLNPNYAKAYANKGCCLVQMNDKNNLSEALVLIDKALALDATLMYAKDCKTEAIEKLKE